MKDEVPAIDRGGNFAQVQGRVKRGHCEVIDSLMARMQAVVIASTVLAVVVVLGGCAASPRLNEIQFVGSHNSYKSAMDPDVAARLRSTNPEAAAALDYAHPPLGEQLDLGLRNLEIDLFNSAQVHGAQADDFVVGHVQVIDMNAHCATLRVCLRALVAWTGRHPRHAPVWLLFNLKDEPVPGLPDPVPFDAVALDRLDRLLREELGERILEPGSVGPGRWPRIDAVRGRYLLILDHTGHKRDLYARNWRQRPMFVTVPPDHPAAAIMVINDPVAEFDLIRERVAAGFLVRTRADADTVEARTGDTTRRDRAFASGAQAVSTDYYRPAMRFGTGYVVDPSPGVWCNPVTSGRSCRIDEEPQAGQGR